MGGWLETIAVRGRPAPASVLCARLRAAPTARAGVTAALAAGTGQRCNISTRAGSRL